MANADTKLATLTSESARGAAALTTQGKVITVYLSAAGRTRECQVVGISEDGSQVTLRSFVGSEARYADVAIARVQIADAIKQQCLVAYSNSQAKPGETSGERMGRQASESPDVINARLWADRQVALKMLNRGARRNAVTGRFAGHSCERAGRV